MICLETLILQKKRKNCFWIGSKCIFDPMQLFSWINSRLWIKDLTFWLCSRIFALKDWTFFNWITEAGSSTIYLWNVCHHNIVVAKWLRTSLSVTWQTQNTYLCFTETLTGHTKLTQEKGIFYICLGTTYGDYVSAPYNRKALSLYGSAAC